MTLQRVIWFICWKDKNLNAENKLENNNNNKKKSGPTRTQSLSAPWTATVARKPKSRALSPEKRLVSFSVNRSWNALTHLQEGLCTCESFLSFNSAAI